MCFLTELYIERDENVGTGSGYWNGVMLLERDETVADVLMPADDYMARQRLI